jgi:hypothetical protein
MAGATVYFRAMKLRTASVAMTASRVMVIFSCTDLCDNLSVIANGWPGQNHGREPV